MHNGDEAEEMVPLGERHLWRFEDLKRAGYVKSRETLRRWMNDEKFPRPIYPEEGSPRWVRKELEEWMERCIQARGPAYVRKEDPPRLTLAEMEATFTRRPRKKGGGYTPARASQSKGQKRGGDVNAKPH